MRVTEISLSDGRSLTYYDSDETSRRTAVDTRGLGPERPPLGVMRRDPLTGEWIAIAGHRQTRTFLPSAAECPICPTSPGNLTEIPEASYQVVVFENRFPSFAAALGDAQETLGPGLPWDTEAAAHGRCEVVAFTDAHTGSVGDLSPAQMELVVRAWMHRTEALCRREDVRYVFVFENRGAEVGVTLHHPHGQIYGYPYLPPAARTLLDQARDHHERTGRSLLADVVAREIAAGDRVVFADEYWIVFVPFAARWPFEVQVHPTRDCSSLVDLSDAEVGALSTLLPHLVRTLDGVFDAPMPYMAGWFQRPARATSDETRDSRLFLRLVSNRRASDKLKHPASSEALMGAFVSDVLPEAAAARLRQTWAEA